MILRKRQADAIRVALTALLFAGRGKTTARAVARACTVDHRTAARVMDQLVVFGWLRCWPERGLGVREDRGGNLWFYAIADTLPVPARLTEDVLLRTIAERASRGLLTAISRGETPPVNAQRTQWDRLASLLAESLRNAKPLGDIANEERPLDDDGLDD